MPVCSRCNASVDAAEIHQHNGLDLCDDCYMDALSPAKSCDPWATYTASRLQDQQLNPAQEKIMELISRAPVPLSELSKATGLAGPALEREMASLRHMELLRATLDQDGKKLFTTFK